MIGAHHDFFLWQEVVVNAVLPLSPFFIWNLFGLTKLPFTISGIFKAESRLLNRIRQNITLKLIWIDIFTPQRQIRHPPSQWPEALYLYISKRYTTAAHRDIGFQLTPLSYLGKFPIQYRIFCVVSAPTRKNPWAVVNPRVICSVLVKTLVGTGVGTCARFWTACEATYPCINVENCGAYVGGFCSASGDYAPDADTICKVNRYKQSQFYGRCIVFHVPRVSLPCWNSHGSINWSRLHDHRLIKPVLWDIYLPTYLSEGVSMRSTKSNTYVIDATGERFGGIVPSHGVTQKRAFSDNHSLGDSFRFKIWDHLLRRPEVSRLVMINDTKIFRIILGTIAGGKPQQSARISSTPVKLGEICHPIYLYHIGLGMYPSYYHIPIEYQVRFVLIVSSTPRIAGESCRPIYL